MRTEKFEAKLGESERQMENVKYSADSAYRFGQHLAVLLVVCVSPTFFANECGMEGGSKRNLYCFQINKDILATLDATPCPNLCVRT